MESSQEAGEMRVTSTPMVIIGMKLKEAQRFKIHFQGRTWLMMDMEEDRFLGNISLLRYN